jgi:hypothetical protein
MQTKNVMTITGTTTNGEAMSMPLEYQSPKAAYGMRAAFSITAKARP